jgi:formylglycine-generating enzyme required for sulfatase activity
MKDPVKDKKSKYSDRVFRGGFWFYIPSNGRASYRDGYYPGYRYADIGFRIVKNGKKNEKSS